MAPGRSTPCMPPNPCNWSRMHLKYLFLISPNSLKPIASFRCHSSFLSLSGPAKLSDLCYTFDMVINISPSHCSCVNHCLLALTSIGSKARVMLYSRSLNIWNDDSLKCKPPSSLTHNCRGQDSLKLFFFSLLMWSHTCTFLKIHTIHKNLH